MPATASTGTQIASFTYRRPVYMDMVQLGYKNVPFANGTINLPLKPPVFSSIREW